ncbi:MAG: sulfatase [Maribacter sp.]|nr:MAG: sulfatase [Maribacter sp.]
MRTVFVLFDSLNRTALGCYGGTNIDTPNFDRFSKRALTYDQHYVGSLPCMPARRDMHTGRLNFTHRSWGPLEPFDNSFAQILKDQGTYTHLISDHLHYFEDGGAGYHTRFQTYDFIRGQEYDPWVAMVEPPIERFKKKYSEKHYSLKPNDKRTQNLINREVIKEEKDFPGARCFESAFKFLDTNKDADNWMMMLECFDPHEPFHAPDRFQDAYKTKDGGKILDWPHYERVCESEAEMESIRSNYAALVAMCDDYFGKLLDYFDAHNMWEDTVLILTTDHGFLLSEHDWWGKCRMPYYEEISHIPLIVHDPRKPEAAGTRTDKLTKTSDIMPTILNIHGAEIPEEVTAQDFCGTDSQTDCVVFGVFGGPIGVSDGRYALYYYPPDIYEEGLREYTLAPSHMNSFFSVKELKTMQLTTAFDFTKGVPVLSIAALPDAKRVPMNDGLGFEDLETKLFDLSIDPKQKSPIEDPIVLERLVLGIERVLREHDTPEEVFDWYGINKQ